MGQESSKSNHQGAKVLWLQLGIVNEHAAEKARRAGLTVIQDACMLVEHRRLFGSK
ncbi:CoA-binding protein [Thermodesulfobacteriota bacterium]